MLRALLLLACVVATSCAVVPNVETNSGSVDSALKPEIVGTYGPLTARQGKALFAKMSVAAQDRLQRHLVIEQAIAETPLFSGNRTRVLRDGGESFRAIFAAIDGAKHHINLEYFIFEDVESDGRRLGELLIAKRREGVAVNVIYDSFGSSGTPRAFFDSLRDGGIALVEFNPMNPFDGKNSYSPNDRDHRKILVVDGATAIVGGVNLSVLYQGASPSGPPAGGAPALPWRDTDLEIGGPVVAQLQKLFVDHWTTQNGPALENAGFFPSVPPQGSEVVRIIGSTPDNLIPRYYVTVLSAIRNSELKIWLMAAYFVPTHQEIEALTEAAQRGVDVKILVPNESDSEMAIAVQHSRYSDLLEAGVEIYESHGQVLHSKTIVVDGVWAVIGSSNFDHRSIVFNEEVDAVVVGSNTARELESMFQRDLTKAHRVDAGSWADRPLSQKFREFFSRIWQTQL